MTGVGTFILISFLAIQQAQPKIASLQNEGLTDVVSNLVLTPAIYMIDASWELQNPSNETDFYWVTFDSESDVQRMCNVFHPDTNTESCDTGDGLFPCTEYNVTVQPRNKNSTPIGVPASAVDYTLSEATDPITPTCTPSGSTTADLQFTVSWSSPGECVLFTVSWEGDVLWQDDEEIIRGNVTTRGASVVIDDPRPYTRYNVTVTWSGGSAHCEDTTAQTAPSAPTSLSVVPASSRSLTASWSAPKQINGVLGDYNISWNADGGKTGSKTTAGTSLTIEGLDACVAYSVTVTASTGGGAATSDAVSGTTEDEAPLAVTSLTKTSSEARSVTLTWTRPDTACDVTDYYISYNGAAMWGTQDKDSGSNTTENISFDVTGLVPYSSYKMCVLGRNGKGNGKESCLEAVETQEAAPGAPASVTTKPSNYTVTVSWQAPKELNGVLRNYLLSWGDSSTQNGSELLPNDTLNYEVQRLEPCHEYSFAVAGVTGGGTGENEIARGSPTTEVSAPYPVTCSLSGSNVTVTWTAPETECDIVSNTVSWEGDVLWSDDQLSDNYTADANDSSLTLPNTVPYTRYTVSVSATVTGGVTGAAEICQDELLTPEAAPTAPLTLTLTEATTSSLSVTWQAPKDLNGWLRNYAITWELGNDAETKNVDNDTLTYKIDGLQGGKSYEISVRAVTSSKSEPVSASFDTLPSNVGDIIGAVIGVLLVAALVAVAFIKRDWIRNNIIKTTETNKSPEGSHPGTAGEDYNEKLLREVQVKLQDVSANPEEKFSELKGRSFVGESKAAILSVNKIKNRYVNILPFDDHRVMLRRRGDSDYINASLVPSSQPYHIDFIACQGPKDNTITDFWHMIWEQDTPIIVMLANCVEAGRPKCSQYWPLQGSLSFPPFTITYEGQKESSSSCTVRTIRITNERAHRVITQCHYSSWPDFGVPDSENELLGLVKEIRGRVDKGKVVVHCSAGVGRTGTFIGLWNLVVAAERKDPGIDVKKTILEMRKYRPELVQSKDQYAYLMRCFAAYLKDPQKWRLETQDQDNSSSKPERHYENVSRPIYEHQDYLGIEMSASAGIGEHPRASERVAQHQQPPPPPPPTRRPLSSNHDYQNDGFIADEIRRDSASTAQPRHSSGYDARSNALPPPQNDLSREHPRPSLPFLQQLSSSLQHPQVQPPRSNTRPPLPKRPVQ